MRKSKPGETLSYFEMDILASQSPMSRWQPGFKVGVGLGSLAVCLVSDQIPLLIFVLCTMVLTLIWVGKIRPGAYLSLILVPGFFVLLSSLAIGLEVRWEKGVEIYGSRAGLLRAGFIALRAFACVSSTFFFALTTPMTEVIELLGSCRLPWVLTELMHLVYRFIFILLKVHGRMERAARSRMGYRGYRTSLRSFSLIGANLLGNSMKGADQYYNAMLARGYRGRLKLLQSEKYQPGWTWWALGAYCLILAGLGIGKQIGGLWI